MSEENTSKNGKKIPPALLIIVAIGLVLGGFAFFKNMNKGEIQAPSSETIAESEASPELETPPPVLEKSSSTEESVSTPVKISVEEVLGVRGMGDVNAPIKIVEYASMTCSHCAHFHNDILPTLKEKYIDTGKVYLQFVEFPLNDPALKATITARCLPEEKYNAFVSLLFKTQDQWAGNVNYMLSLKQNAKLAGLSEDEFEACHSNPDIKLGIAENIQNAQEKWKINSTPTFIINDGKEKIGGAVPIEEFERVFRKVSDNNIGQVPTVE